MRKNSKSHLCVAVSVLALAVGMGLPAQAQEGTSVRAQEGNGVSLQVLQDQINTLQKQLAQIQAAQAKAAKETAATKKGTPKTTAKTEPQSDSLKGIIKTKTGADVTLGGFIDMTMINRDKNQAADTGSSFNTALPFKNAVQSRENEFRGGARASRITLLATANADSETKLTGYFESDFGGTGTSSTPGQTNSYVPRIRQAFAAYEDTPSGLQFMAGQAWSLVTMGAAGINPLKPLFPMVIDAAFMPGVNYARTPQIRVTKGFDDNKGAFALSIESPQVTTGGICTSTTASQTNNPSFGTNSCAGFNSNIKLTASAFTANMQGSLSTDIAPDVVAKVAYDTQGWGHYELFGVTRFFRDTMVDTGKNNHAIGAGVGVGAFVPVIPKKLEVQAAFAAGNGIGRYGVAQLPDFSLTTTGAIKPLEHYTALLGIIGHPTPTLDTYLYAGLEQTFRHDVGLANNGLGYGNFGASNANCNTVNTTTNCMAQTSSVWQITPGFWYRVYDGSYGKMQVGLQHSWTRRNTFSDSSSINPHSINNMTLFSVRFFPF